MSRNLRARARAAVVVSVTVAATTMVASPAWASLKRDDGDQPGDPMSVGTALLLFVGLPLTISAVIWLLVLAPGWTRGGRASSADAWTGDPLVLDSSAPAGATGSTAAIEGATSADADSDTPGGTSARW